MLSIEHTQFQLKNLALLNKLVETNNIPGKHGSLT